ncbi:MAG TPA: hypothetical protein VHE09_17110 [Rhizomicrobium sp.]|nr:hypothetical protein [Rhizomicrobium sp.]
MNPEFQRNVWIELTPRRLILMVVLLTLAFFASAIAGGSEYDLASTARLLFYAIVVVWGSRNAALAVVGEIRDRTWDMQLLSSITPGAMTWGKLFGSTIYNWFGGVICLAVLEAERITHAGLASALIDLVYFIAVGVISQAAAFLASLVAVSRRQSHSRLDIFVYQTIGLLAGVAVYTIWSIADPAGSFLLHKMAGDAVTWWGRVMDRRGFLLLSLAIFTVWTLLGCYRGMRLELKMQNGTLVWLAWLVFIGVYVAGFDAWLSNDKTVAGWDAASLRLALAGATFTVLTYLMVFLEPKDRVHFRWLGTQLSSGRIGAFWNGLQAWMMSYFAAVICTAILLFRLYQNHPDIVDQPALIAAAAGFLTRDVLVFVFMRSLPGRRRGDFAALGILFALYVLAPAIINGLGLKNLLMLFYPFQTSPVWMGSVVAWTEGIAMAVLAFGQVALSRKPATA